MLIKYRVLTYGIHGETLENKTFNSYKEAENYAKTQSNSYNIQSFTGKKDVIKIKDKEKYN